MQRHLHATAGFREFVMQAAPGLKIVGPGDVLTANAPCPAPRRGFFLTAKPPPRFDVFSYHSTGVSQRWRTTDHPMVGTVGTRRYGRWFERTDRAFKDTRQYAITCAGSSNRVTETAQAPAAAARGGPPSSILSLSRSVGGSPDKA